MTFASDISLGQRTLFRLSIGGCFKDAIGDGGLDAAAFDAALSRAQPALERLKQLRGDGGLALLTVADDVASVETIKAAYHRLTTGAQVIVFFGTGGSGLGGQTLAQFGGWSIPGVGTLDPKGS
ncbi:MAG: hypothetical protein KKB37_09330, partial [Alphaproteobacteria bacterium]|nr:hypothetical protein [Alphaproteobacteria bacterium]